MAVLTHINVKAVNTELCDTGHRRWPFKPQDFLNGLLHYLVLCYVRKDPYTV